MLRLQHAHSAEAKRSFGTSSAALAVAAEIAKRPIAKLATCRFEPASIRRTSTGVSSDGMTGNEKMP